MYVNRCKLSLYFQIEFIIIIFCLQLRAQIEQNAGNKEKLTELEQSIKERTQALLQVYHTVALHFADLHDTPERMLEKGCINEILPWRTSRSWLHWRLRRLLMEHQIVKNVIAAHDNQMNNVQQARETIFRWFVEDKGATEAHLWGNNQEAANWLVEQMKECSVVAANLNAVKRDAIISQIRRSLEERPDVALDTVIGLCQTLSSTQRGEVVRTLAQLDLTNNSE